MRRSPAGHGSSLASRVWQAALLLLVVAGAGRAAHELLAPLVPVLAVVCALPLCIGIARSRSY